METKPKPGAMPRHFQLHASRAVVGARASFRDAPLRATIAYVESLTPAMQWLLAILLILLVGMADSLTDPELSFSIFYALPIAMLGWHRGWRSALASVFLATAIWLTADLFTGPSYSHPMYRSWNAIVRFAFFFLIGYIISQLRRAVNEEQRLARTDSLTGVANSRSFLETASLEVARQQRYAHPLSLAFLDCDNFKEVNDQFGHATGDGLLRRIALGIQASLRGVDTVARLGGDEFAILLPESDANAAETVCNKVRDALTAEVADFHVTFSVGIVTYRDAPNSVEELVHNADQAMYEAKKTGKNSSRHRIIVQTSAEEPS